MKNAKDMFKELLMKKAQSGETIEPEESKAKSHFLQELLSELDSEKLGQLKPKQSMGVEVAASSPEDLKKGLDKAKSLVGKNLEMFDKEPEEELDEPKEEEEELPMELPEDPEMLKKLLKSIQDKLAVAK